MLLLTNGTGAQRGLETDVTGINAESFSVRYFFEVDDMLPGITGEVTRRAHSAKFSRDISFSGEVTSLGTPAGVMLFAATTAISTQPGVLGNDVASFGDGTGTIYLSEVTENQTRGGWRSVDFRMFSRPLLTGTPA